MKKINVYSLEGKVTGEMELPEIFSEEYRPDLIKEPSYLDKVLVSSPGEQTPWPVNEPPPNHSVQAEEQPWYLV